MRSLSSSRKAPSRRSEDEAVHAACRQQDAAPAVISEGMQLAHSGRS